MSSSFKQKGCKGFGETYWQENYSAASTMDGVGNAIHHARYLKSLFDVEYVDISSVVDLGMGLGAMFKAILKEFKPYNALGIEPSEFVFSKLDKKKLSPVASTKLKLLQTDIVSWCKSKEYSKEVFDLGVCTSVFQYLDDLEIAYCLPILAKRIKYFYFSVPTHRELEIQRNELKFHDRFAISRPKSFYLKALKPYFTIISNRLLESKYFFSDRDSYFTDLMYRF